MTEGEKEKCTIENVKKKHLKKRKKLGFLGSINFIMIKSKNEWQRGKFGGPEVIAKPNEENEPDPELSR